jgi:hypothetical protein
MALWLTIRDEHEASMRATASALGADWERVHAEGRALTQDQAIAEARASAALPPSIATG